MKESKTIALALATSLSGSLAVYAQTERPTVHHHYHLHHHHPPYNPASAPIAQRPGEESAPPQTNQMFKPYARPGEGDNDGLSSDPDDCMKGCIGGNPG